MSITLAVSAAAARVTSPAASSVDPSLRQAAPAAASLVARPAMARDEVSATEAANAQAPSGLRLAVLAAGAAFAGSTVGLAFFLSRRPNGNHGEHDAKFRA